MKTIKEATSVIGSLGYPSKMPGTAWDRNVPQTTYHKH